MPPTEQKLQMEGGSDDEEEAKQAKAVNIEEIQMEEV